MEERRSAVNTPNLTLQQPAATTTMENFLSVYGSNTQIPSFSSAGSDSQTGWSGSPVASTSSASQHTSPELESGGGGQSSPARQHENQEQNEKQKDQGPEEGPLKAAKKQARRSCDPCRLRRVRCVRQPKSTECEKCLAMGIKCTESAPRARTSQKGARIAQAKMLYGDTTGAAAMALVVRNGKVGRELAGFSNLPGNAETLMVASMDVSILLNDLIPSVAKLKVTRLPLLRWIDITGEFEAANGKLSNMDPVSQALFLSLAALSARTSHSELVVGKDAPSLTQVSKDAKLRSSIALCEYGRRREPIAKELLDLAHRKLNENHAFVTPTLRSAAALATTEMLILVYQDSLAFTRSASRSARPLSAAVASHLRIIAEECNGMPSTPFGFYSVAWTSIIRDALVSSVTGRTLDFTTNDLFLILKINEDEPITVPSPQVLMDSWLAHPLEGPVLMQLWACVLICTRSFVNEITQPLAVARPRLNIAYFDNFYTTMLKCRMSLAEALALLKATNRSPPDQKRVISYSMDFMMAQAHRIILWRCSEEQLARARQAPAPLSGTKEEDWESYKIKLQVLRAKSTEEAFQAARRIMSSIMDIFSPEDEGKAEFFVPGYFVYEGLLVWTSLLLDTRAAEEGGRADYSISEKLKDLTSLREAIAITGWSSGLVQPHLEQLNSIIFELEQKQASFTAPPAGFFSQFVDLNAPTPQTQHLHPPPHEQAPAQYQENNNRAYQSYQEQLPASTYASEYPPALTGEADPFSLNYFGGEAAAGNRQDMSHSNPMSAGFWQSSGFNLGARNSIDNSVPQNSMFEDVLATPAVNGAAQPLFSDLNTFDSVAIDQFLESIGFQMSQ